MAGRGLAVALMTSMCTSAYTPKLLSGPAPFDMSQIHPSGPKLRIDVMTMPAYGHYMTTKDIAIALARRGHEVTFVLCDRSRPDFLKDGLAGLGIRWRSAGNCSIYDDRESVMADLISTGSPTVMLKMLESVAELAYQMCEALMPQYDVLAAEGSLPHAILFDADSYCAMDISIKHKIPRVARVGTGLRDAYTTPVYAPLYSSGSSVAMDTMQRLGNAAMIVLSRVLLAPVILPQLYGRHRDDWLAADPAEGSASAGLTTYHRSPAYSFSLDERVFHPDLLWDGVHTLYNSHWGLEHPRPLQPFEHLIGHTNDFVSSAQQGLGEHNSALESWLDASPDVPVVYVGLGTLSIVPKRFLDTLASAFVSSKRFRFVWSVPASQQDSMLSETLRNASLSAECACSASKAPQCAALMPSSFSCADAATPGSVFLVSWAPQLPILLHNSTSVFIAHGGMNGVAETTYARTPMLCIPFFSDQPDNCAHAADHGFAIALDWKQLTPEDVTLALDRLHDDVGFRSAVQSAWVENVAAGGIHRAVQIVEASASQPYGAHLARIPRYHYMPWWQAWNLDVILIAAILVASISWNCWMCCKRCSGRCSVSLWAVTCNCGKRKAE